MTCTITLYKDAKIIPSKNFIVEGIENYLSTLTHIELTKFQYIRNDLNLTIKINKSQTYTEINSTYNYNYVKVYQNSIAYYYFVMKKTQISQDTIALELLMDTLNTFSWDSGYKVSPRTRVIREHKARLASGGRKKFSEVVLEDVNGAGAYTEAGDIIRILLWQDGQEWTEEEVEAFEAGLYTYEIYQIKDHDDGDRVLQPWEYEGEATLYFEVDPEGRNCSVYGAIPLNNSNLIGHLFYITIIINLYAPALTRKIDFFSENIQVNLYKTMERELTQKENDSWNLIYQTGASDTDPVDCFLCPSSTSLKFVQSSSNSLTYTSFEDGMIYFITPCRGVESQWEWIEPILTDNNGVEYKAQTSGNQSYVIQIERTGTTLKVRQLKIKNASLSSANRLYTGPWNTITSISFNVERLYYNLYLTAPTYFNYSVIPPTYFEVAGTSVSIDPLYKIDRAEPKLVKIITIPYYPTSYLWDSVNNEITPLDDVWTPSGNLLKLNDLNSKFLSTIYNSGTNPLNVFKLINVSPSATDLRNDLYESKLFHSDYYRPKFVYDSFGFNFQLEKIDETKFEETDFYFDFIMTTTINSKFMFRFPQYVLKLSEEDYDNILPIARNNEQPIYNSSYITYLRTAYRYDLKTLDINRTNTISSFLTDYTNRVGSGIESAFKENWSGFAKTITNMPNLVIQTAMGLYQKQNSLESKLEQLKNQAVSVSGSDDIDLLEAYSDNRAKLVVYEVHSRVKKLLADLFYYYGYNTDEIKKPSIDTRYWFNFLQCELELTGVDNNITQILKDNIISRFLTGATFLHNHSNTWDFDQVKENWESSLLS